MGSYIDQDVRQELTWAREMCRLDVGSQLANFYEKQQELEQCIITASNAAGDRLEENNNRNDNQERISKEISDTLTGLTEEVKENRNCTQLFQEKQAQIERKIEEEKKNISIEIKKGIGPVTQQEGNLLDRKRNEQTTFPQNSSVGIKSEVRVVEPPGLSYGGGGAQRVFGQIPKTRPTHTTLPGADTDSIMAEENATQEQEKGISRYSQL